MAERKTPTPGTHLPSALQMPLVAVDLPGHGQSDWRRDHEYGVSAMADDVASVVRQTAPESSILVGIGLGCPVALLTADRLSPAIERLVLVDSAPGAGIPNDTRAPSAAGASVAAFTAERRFASFEEALKRAIAYNPGRSVRSLRRGVIHNAKEMPDGTWEWRWDPRQRDNRDYAPEALEAALARFTGPILLVRGGRSDIVSDEIGRPRSRGGMPRPASSRSKGLPTPSRGAIPSRWPRRFAHFVRRQGSPRSLDLQARPQPGPRFMGKRRVCFVPAA